MPTVNIWCAHTTKDNIAIDNIAQTIEAYPNKGLREKVSIIWETIPNAGKIIM